jgi:hypothetical protein
MRKAIAFLIAAATCLGLPAVAVGNHLHSVQTGNGGCVVWPRTGVSAF